MSGKVMKALSKGFVNRMKDWATATLLPDCSLVPSSWPSDGPKGSASYDTMRTPRMLGFVHETQAALDELDPRYRRAVCLFWWRPEYSISAIGRELSVSDVAACTWIMEGHEQLKAIFARQRDTWEREHERGEDEGRLLLLRRAVRFAQ